MVVKRTTPIISRRSVLALLGLAGTASIIGCGTGDSRVGTGLIAQPVKNVWPARFWEATHEVQEAYRFALRRPDVLQYMPCFCGCGATGHASNKDCYIAEMRSNGTFVLDEMSFG